MREAGFSFIYQPGLVADLWMWLILVHPYLQFVPAALQQKFVLFSDRTGANPAASCEPGSQGGFVV